MSCQDAPSFFFFFSLAQTLRERERMDQRIPHSFAHFLQLDVRKVNVVCIFFFLPVPANIHLHLLEKTRRWKMVCGQWKLDFFWRNANAISHYDHFSNYEITHRQGTFVVSKDLKSQIRLCLNQDNTIFELFIFSSLLD